MMRDTPQTDETHIFQIKYTTATVYLLLYCCVPHTPLTLTYPTRMKGMLCINVNIVRYVRYVDMSSSASLWYVVGFVLIRIK